MDLKELDSIFYCTHPKIKKIEQVGTDVVLEFSENSLYIRFVFKDAKINIDVDSRLAVNLLDYSEYINSKDYMNFREIEIYYPEYGIYDDNSYYFKLHLLSVPEEWFDYSTLKVKTGYRVELEEPIMSFVTTNLSIEYIEEEKDENETKNINKIDNFNFHDSEISDFKIDNTNISFSLNGGWFKDTYYKFFIDNSDVFVTNCDKKYLKYLINKLTNDKIVVFSGESGILDNNKSCLKLWFDYPYDTLDDDYEDFNNKLGDIDINLCDEYDDTGRLYIKFIAEDIDVVRIVKCNM